MRPSLLRAGASLALALCIAPAIAEAPTRAVEPPDQQLAPLFQQVQRAHLFADQKTFADAVPRQPAAAVLDDWRAAQQRPGYTLRDFIATRFNVPEQAPAYVPPAGETLRAHIEGLWPVLQRHTASVDPHGSLLPLPHPYVVPGGRFREVYYWDSYFTLLGLASSQRWQQVRDMVDNFAWQLDQYGHIPNGNRSYYLSRSQPPFFSLMVELLARHEGDDAYRRYLPQLRIEHAFWMHGAEGLAPGQAHERVVRLADGQLLNRYWDARAVPRTESWTDDLATAAQAPGRPPAQVYRDLRAGAESGWDFSSRWLDDPAQLSSIRTTAIVPVDLNSLLFHLEQMLAQASAVSGAGGDARHYRQLAAARRAAINTQLWDARQGYYVDRDLDSGQQRPALTAAALFPLWLKIAGTAQARRTADAVEVGLLRSGGLLTTQRETGQQWDAPNGWAPLQWVAVDGLQQYGQQALARTLGVRFLRTVQSVYDRDGKLVEKYVVDGSASGGGGGEYPLQDGFGWSNGVTLALLDRLCAPERICESAGDVE
ncbi:alpha,alpha-trehalase [Stenotrophomonas sp. ESTM1D_MKCIP4_1]|uniref:alpha,alpha-trehalase TreA n=1 Tax=Stenotrophomonas sp. ESTM1D_MKCIP4_1 TaxID=2072414 RepID=UPI000D53F426|nr:alpha,alpha-trehalase TreA [Stenotrophomonas sp. ESTM1D_MKCIP4_1]AWH52728.1 alpha,alpha-trehalase [Stenotrophomonas sp. ESTM1D_MKCIP4_1]